LTYKEGGMPPGTPLDHPTTDDAIRTIVIRLARPHPQGDVIERAAILAEGAVSAAIVDWIIEHAGKPEAVPSSAVPRGLHGVRSAGSRTPLRYVLPAGALAS
jgi:hypothetical protein